MENIQSNFDVRRQWWNKLGKVLKEKDIDINSKADIARLVIFNIQVNEKEKRYDVFPCFATDIEQHPIEDGIDREEILKRQKTGVPGERLFWQIYNAAQEGRLFLHSDGTEMGMMIEVDEKGDPKECLDVLNAPEEVFCADALFKPEKPSKPWGITYVLAFFGVSSAKDKINSYNEAVATYTKNTENWNKMQEMGESLAARRRNQCMVFDGYFSGVANSENMVALGQKLQEVHDDEQFRIYSEMEGKKEIVDDYKKYDAVMKEVLNDFSEQFYNKQMDGGSRKNLSEENNMKFARLVSAFLVSRSAYNALKNGDDHSVVSDKTFNDKVSALYSSDDFKHCLKDVNESSIVNMVGAFREGEMSRTAFMILDKCYGIKEVRDAMDNSKAKKKELLTEKDNKNDKTIEEKNLGELTNNNVLGGLGH